ncbi:MAG: hypothetical protein DMD36_16560 [Gemmatimonadetes bacterium]|nr:MAG: hypothetical protein DMD36_16560 [Gemmatimonadota bacterium]
MGAIMAWLARSRARTRPAADAQRLTHPRSTLIVGLACSFLFSGVALASALWPGKTGSPGISLAFLAFAALGVPLILDYRNARHTLTEDGLRYGRTWGGGGTLRWREVRRLRYSAAWKWFRLEGPEGQVARAALAQVPAAAIDPQTRPVLEATAQGNPPSLWQ